MMKTKISIPLACIVLMSLLQAGFAERLGDFDFFIQPVKDTDSQVKFQGVHVQKTEKSQSMCYKVRADYKGLDMLSGVEVLYVMGVGNGNEKVHMKSGRQSVGTLKPGGQIEFVTDSADHAYMEYRVGGQKSQSGKADLKGLTLRIVRGKDVLVEWAQPSDAAKYWDEVPARATDPGSGRPQGKEGKMRRRKLRP